MIPVPGETPGAWRGNTGWEQARIDAALTAAAVRLLAAVPGGALAWADPVAYLVLTETALAGNVTTP